MDIRKLLAVAKWEFIEKARTKAFLISLVLTPALMVITGIVPSFLASRSETDTKKFAVYDETESLREPAQERLAKRHKLENGKPSYDLVPVNTTLMPRDVFLKEYTPRVLKGDFTGLFLIPKNVDSLHTMEYRSSSLLFRFRDRGKEPDGFLPPAFYMTPTMFLDATVFITQGQ